MGRRREEIFRIDRNPHRVRRFLGHLLLTVLMLALIAGVANFAISRDVALENVYVTVANLPEDLENYSILHLSDLHGATFGERQAGIRNALGSERFSLCVMTGDMLGPEGDTSALENLNTVTALTPDQVAAKRVAQYQLARVEKIRSSLREIQPTDIQIVLTHAPLNAEYAQTLRGWSERGDVFSIRQSALVLAGHLCGGQWRLPWLGAVHVPEYGWFPEDSLVTGVGWPGGVRQYISPGLGASGAYPWWQSFRLFNRPVMTKVYLTARERGR